MAAAPPPDVRRRPRPGSPERPISARTYRGTWLLVALPLLVAAFSVGRPAPLPRPTLPPAFDRSSALELAHELAGFYPDRSPGSPGAAAAAAWFSRQLAPYGFPVQTDRFSATIPGQGRVRLENLSVVVPGASPDAIVVMAHRDDAGTGPGANDNASGTAAMIELARAYANPPSVGGRPTTGRVSPAHTLVFLSTDGGAFGGLGAAHFAATHHGRLIALINLDALAGRGAPRLVLAGDAPRSPPATLVATAAARIADQTGDQPARPRALAQLIDLAFPFSLYEQAPFVGRSIPAVTLTSAAERPPAPVGDAPGRLNPARLAQLGRAAQDLLGSLDQGLELSPSTASYVYLGSRIVRGWAVRAVLVAALLPFLIAAVDLFARCRRRRIPLGPALRSYRSRLGVWLWIWGLFELFALLGFWPGGAGRPPAPGSAAAGRWPVFALAALAVLGTCGWLVARERLLPRRPVRRADELAGHTVALLALGIVALLVVATNAFALLFLLPSLHAWLWVPHIRDRGLGPRAAVLLAGFAGPLLLLGSFAVRFGLGADAPWYVAELLALGYVPLPSFLIGIAWLAAAGQVAAVAAGRYAPYPSAAERPPRGPVRNVVRRTVLAIRAWRHASESADRALEA